MPRELAVKVIEDIIYRKLSFEISFSHHLKQTQLESRDRAFSYRLIATTLRRLGQIDDLISGCLVKPLEKKASKARTILRLGVAQLLFLDIPPHAAVNTSVELAQKMQQGPYKNLINAVLRRLGREGSEVVNKQDAAKLNTVDWLWKSWTLSFGEETCRKISEVHLYQPPLDLTVKINAKNWSKKLSGQLLNTGSVRLYDYSTIDLLSGYKEGAWWVQDAAAAIPVKLLGQINGLRIGDLCAAPGGKTSQLAAAGAQVTAVEKSSDRLEILEKNLIRLNLNAELILADALSWRPNKLFDAILIDAPCTATGTIRRHPDIQFLKRPIDVNHIIATQKALLEAAFEMVKPNGMVIYTTCSLQEEEGPGIISALLHSSARIRRYPIKTSEIPGIKEFITPDGDLRTLPCYLSDIGGMDGFFAARLVHN